jgi:putative FmdB family regulatory protein
MPLYEYQCRACGQQFEALVRGGSTLPACPECQSQDLERLLSMFAVSSETTKNQALKDGRQRGMKVKREKDHAQMEYEKHHQH